MKKVFFVIALLCYCAAYAQNNAHNPTGYDANEDRRRMDNYVNKKIEEAKKSPSTTTPPVQKK
jgi:hypothetical protein